MTTQNAVVLLSGGLDSATTLAIACSEGYSCYCLSIDYGQRHRAEIDAARRIARLLRAAEHHVVDLDLTAFGGSALTDKSIDVPTGGLTPGIPRTYVPARNTADIFFGANAVDYSGYPDCRPEYMRAFESLANLATKAAIEGRNLNLHTPIITLSKAEIILRGITLGVDYALTVSCYQAADDGLACGVCDSCRIRRAGFEAAGLPDPTRYVTIATSGD